MANKEIIIDGSDKIVGREATFIAKQLLNGSNVVLLNAEKMMMSGHRPDLFAKYKHHIELKDKANPEHSPHFPRKPDLFVKRIIRGMLPYKRPKGKEAFKKLRVYIGVPDQYKAAKLHDTKSKDSSVIFENLVTIKELTGLLGYKE